MAQDLEAFRELKLGEFSDDPTLNLSEARIILEKSLEARDKRVKELDPNHQGPTYKESDILIKTRDYLQLFAAFKDMQSAEVAERTINELSDGMERFERSQIGTLVPGTADEAKALIPSLEKKCEEGIVNETDLEALCKELTRLRQTNQMGM